MDGPEHIEALKKFLDQRGNVYKLKQSLFTQIGRTVVAHSKVEYNLLVLFEMISRPLTDAESLDVYKKSGEFKRKLNLVDYAVRALCTAEELAEWSSIKRTLDSTAHVRNNSAHYNLSLSFDDDFNPLAASLVRPPFAPFGKEGHIVDKKAIEQAGITLEKAAFDIGELAVMVADRLYPEEMARYNASSDKK